MENETEENTDIICTNCGKLFHINRENFDSHSDFDNLCSDCQAKSCSLFFGLFSDFKGE